jgi:ABC-2 type transport system ATP-binding protein
MERCNVAYIQNRLVGNISKGNRQRVTLAQALLGEPRILLLDEPTSAMDPAEVIKIRQFIRSLGGSMTVLLSSHILSEVSQVCDHLIFIREGRIRYEGSIKEVGSIINLSVQRVALRFATDVAGHLAQLGALPGGQVMGTEGLFVQVDISDEGAFFPAFYQYVAQHNLPLREIAAREHQLESLFRDAEVRG